MFNYRYLVMTMYFKVFNPDVHKSFQDIYNEKPHLYKRHEKKFIEEYDSKYTELANSFIPDDIQEWYENIKNLQLKNYECSSYSKIDRIDNLILVSFFQFYGDKYHIDRLAIFELDENDEKLYSFYYSIKTIGRDTPCVMLHCDGKYQMGSYTDYDRFYTQKQRFLDKKSYEIIKSISSFKYLPVEKLKHINAFFLFEYMENKDWLYQIEILLKMGKKGLATDVFFDRQPINMNYFKMFKKDIIRGKRLTAINLKISEFTRKEENQKLRIERKEMAKKFKEMPKVVYEFGDYVLKTPDTIDELEKEGRELHHCVASYLKKIVEMKTIILFLRKKENIDEPYYTVEVNPSSNNVIQCRTYSNLNDDVITNMVNQFIIDKPLGVLLNGNL